MMRRFAVFTALISLSASVAGDYGQTSRCYVEQDASTRRIVTSFLNSAIECLPEEGNMDRVLRCAQERLDAMPLISPLVHTLKTWQKYYHDQFNTTYQLFGLPERVQTNPWVVLLGHWYGTGALCFYDNEPQISDHISPRPAGMLTLFFKEDLSRSPVLKGSTDWIFNGSMACSAMYEQDGTRQVDFMTTVSPILQQPNAAKDSRQMTLMRGFSTDPFLQAFISTWKLSRHSRKRYSCPKNRVCGKHGGKGTIHVPANSKEYFSLSSTACWTGKEYALSSMGRRTVRTLLIVILPTSADTMTPRLGRRACGRCTFQWLHPGCEKLWTHFHNLPRAELGTW